MAYTRKTKDICVLIWHGPQGKEEIDQFDTHKEAKLMKKEYLLCYGGQIDLVWKREKV